MNIQISNTFHYYLIKVHEWGCQLVSFLRFENIRIQGINFFTKCIEYHTQIKFKKAMCFLPFMIFLLKTITQDFILRTGTKIANS